MSTGTKINIYPKTKMDTIVYKRKKCQKSTHEVGKEKIPAVTIKFQFTSEIEAWAKNALNEEKTTMKIEVAAAFFV